MNIKKRHWWFVLYPESAKADWKEELTDRGLPFCVSPLHEYDVDGEGALKKPHYHVITSFSGPTTYSNVKLLCEYIGATIPKAIDNIQGAFDYLIHANHPTKYQYSSDDIQQLNGFDISRYINESEYDKAINIIHVCNVIKSEHINEYAALIDYFVEQEQFALVNWVSCHTIFVNSYIKSYRYSKDKEGD